YRFLLAMISLLSVGSVPGIGSRWAGSNHAVDPQKCFVFELRLDSPEKPSFQQCSVKTAKLIDPLRCPPLIFQNQGQVFPGGFCILMQSLFRKVFDDSFLNSFLNLLPDINRPLDLFLAPDQLGQLRFFHFLCLLPSLPESEGQPSDVIPFHLPCQLVRPFHDLFEHFPSPPGLVCFKLIYSIYAHMRIVNPFFEKSFWVVQIAEIMYTEISYLRGIETRVY